MIKNKTSEVKTQKVTYQPNNIANITTYQLQLNTTKISTLVISVC